MILLLLADFKKSDEAPGIFVTSFHKDINRVVRVAASGQNIGALISVSG